MDSAIGLWERVKAQIELETPRPNFDTWLRPTRAAGWDGDSIVVETPAKQGVTRLSGPMREQIERRLCEASGGVAGYIVRCKTAGEKL
jgi:chromosomal replication initiation ATPase DnaA